MDFDRFDRDVQALLGRASKFQDAEGGGESAAARPGPDVLAWVAEAAERLAAARVVLRDVYGMIDRARLTAEEHARRYKELFEGAPVGYLVTDATGLVVECNQSAADLFGEPVDAIVGRPMHPRFEDGGRCFEDALARLAVGGVVPDLSIRLRNGGCGVVDVTARVGSRPDDDGEPAEILWVLHRTGPAPAPPGPSGVESTAPPETGPAPEVADGEVGREGDPARARNGGRGGRRRGDRPDPVAIHEVDRGSHAGRGLRRALRKILAGLVASSHARAVVMRIDDAEGGPLVLTAGSPPVDEEDGRPAGPGHEPVGGVSPRRSRMVLRDRSGGSLGSVDFFFDESDGPSVGGERLTRLLVRRAEDRIQVDRLGRRLSDAEARNRRALAVMAHEMRTPLSVILNSAYLLAQSGQGDQEVEEMAERLTRQATYMSRLVEDLLDHVRPIGSPPRLSFEEVDLEAAMRGAAEAIGPMASAKGQRLVVSPLPSRIRIQADPQRLEQMMTNLLGNAIRYTRAGGSISLSVQQVGDEIVLKVQDDGVGLEPSEATRIFRPFVHSDDGRSNPEGLGLGLFLVKTLAEGHGGSIACTSGGRDRGSEFTLRLPVNGDRGVI